MAPIKFSAASTVGRTVTLLYDGASRPFLGVLFQCCRVYRRIYQTADRLAYAGHCPRCALPVRVVIGKEGTSARFFKAGR